MPSAPCSAGPRPRPRRSESGGLRLAGLQAELEDLLFQPLYEHGSNTWGDVRFLKLGKLRIKSLRADRESVRAFLEGSIPGLHISALELDKTVKVRGREGSIQFAAEASVRLEASPPALRIEIVSAQWGEPAAGFLPGAFPDHPAAADADDRDSLRHRGPGADAVRRLAVGPLGIFPAHDRRRNPLGGQCQRAKAPGIL